MDLIILFGIFAATPSSWSIRGLRFSRYPHVCQAPPRVSTLPIASPTIVLHGAKLKLGLLCQSTTFTLARNTVACDL